MLRVDHRCLDGSPFPIAFADPDDVRTTWFLDREHAPEAMSPLADAVRPLGQPGEARAYEDCGVTLPPSLGRVRPVANGYAYGPPMDLSPEGWERLGAELRELAHRYGGTAAVWAEHCLPPVQEDCAWLRDAPAATPFAVLAERREHAWGMTSVAGLVARVDERAVAASCVAVVGGRATEVAYLLAQGSGNETLDADRALIDLAAMDPTSDAYAAARRSFLADFGGRAVSWSIDHPTFTERPDLLDAQLDLVRRHGHRGVDDVTRGAAARRARLVDEITAALDEDGRSRFLRRLARLESFVPVREARARWQLVASGALRGAVQARGRLLVERGVLDHVDDVFFLTPAEYDDPVGELRSVVADRRAEHRRWSSIVPPPTIGAPVDGDRDGDGDGDGDHDRIIGAPLRGVPGSPGTATGTARVIVDLDDVERLDVGDVLVTTMTSPPWTPLFGIAAAVVTDAGDALSHVAIAAREYGIPCVAGTDHATALVPDGSTVTVDGDAGIVHLR
jgi:phosphohistidine swiveling domain-containing protein